MNARIILSLLLFALPAVAFAADPPELQPGKKLEDELVGNKKDTRWPGFVDFYHDFMVDHIVTLKAGDKITLTGTVTGKGRRLAVALLDPTGQIIAATKRDTDVSGTKLVVDEVPASGKYTVRFVSNQIGAYTVKADYLAPKGKDLKAEAPSEVGSQERFARIEKELAEMKKELAETKAKLKELQDKK
jgi:hypothetical protein